MIPERLDQITDLQANQICGKLREQIIECVSETGGHLASSLGVVELTVALHRVFDLNEDRLVWDVGHQCYAHKILTGRGKQMKHLRQFGGISGFPKPKEHRSDSFIAGHASNSISVALGMARARTIGKEDYHVIAVIGDGAMTGGLAFEGLCNAGQSGEPMIVVLNDNGMSITKNVGGVASHLSRQRLKPQYLRMKKAYRKLLNRGKVCRSIYRMTHKMKQIVKDAILSYTMFEDMGFTYLGPVDGHDVGQLTRLLQYARDLGEPVLLHIKTVKGKGYLPAEREPDRFHGVSPFHVEDGTPKSVKKGETFSGVFGKTVCALAAEQENVCAITAAMQSGTGLDGFAAQYPDRFFDVGIAEEHAAAMAAGMAKQGMVPVFAVYSSFLQRSYDMLLHDVGIQNLRVIFGVDRAGLVGEDGETHHGVFDIGYLSTVPGMRIYCPASFAELESMMRHAVLEQKGPAAIRYPRGGEGAYHEMSGVEGTSVLCEGTDITLITYGVLINEVLSAAEILKTQGVSVQVLKLNSISPLDMDTVMSCIRRTGRVLVAEECVDAGCVGRRIASELVLRGQSGVKLALVNLGDRFIPQGTVAQLRALCDIDSASLCKKAMELMADG